MVNDTDIAKDNAIGLAKNIGAISTGGYANMACEHHPNLDALEVDSTDDSFPIVLTVRTETGVKCIPVWK